jgi:hypothetical protein
MNMKGDEQLNLFVFDAHYNQTSSTFHKREKNKVRKSSHHFSIIEPITYLTKHRPHV